MCSSEMEVNRFRVCASLFASPGLLMTCGEGLLLFLGQERVQKESKHTWKRHLKLLDLNLLILYMKIDNKIRFKSNFYNS